jgi:hypothetical protein
MPCAAPRETAVLRAAVLIVLGVVAIVMDVV